MDLLVVVGWIICAFITYNQAQKKGLNAQLWAVLGLVFGIFGVLAITLAKPKSGEAKTSSAGLASASGSGTPLAGGVAGGALGATAAAGATPAQQNAMKNLKEFAREKIEEQDEETTDSEFNADDMDF